MKTSAIFMVIWTIWTILFEGHKILWMLSN